MENKTQSQYWAMAQKLIMEHRQQMRHVCSLIITLDGNRKGKNYDRKLLTKTVKAFLELEISIRKQRKDTAGMMLAVSESLNIKFDHAKLMNTLKTIIKVYDRKIEEDRERIQTANIASLRKQKSEMLKAKEQPKEECLAAKPIKDKISYEQFREDFAEAKRDDLMHYVFNMHLEEDFGRFMSAKHKEAEKKANADKVKAMLKQTGMTIEEFMQYAK